MSKDKDFYKNMFPVSGLSSSISKSGKITDSRNGTRINCDNCGISFRRPASHLDRTNNHYCSRSCADEGRKQKNIRMCRVCGKEMILTNSNMARIFTCSIPCKSKYREGDSPTKYNWLYKKDRKINIKNACDNCGSEEKLKYRKPYTFCERCHSSDISPYGLKARKTKWGY